MNNTESQRAEIDPDALLEMERYTAKLDTFLTQLLPSCRAIIGGMMSIDLMTKEQKEVSLKCKKVLQLIETTPHAVPPKVADVGKALRYIRQREENASTSRRRNPARQARQNIVKLSSAQMREKAFVESVEKSFQKWRAEAQTKSKLMDELDGHVQQFLDNLEKDVQARFFKNVQRVAGEVNPSLKTCQCNHGKVIFSGKEMEGVDAGNKTKETSGKQKVQKDGPVRIKMVIEDDLYDDKSHDVLVTTIPEVSHVIVCKERGSQTDLVDVEDNEEFEDADSSEEFEISEDEGDSESDVVDETDEKDGVEPLELTAEILTIHPGFTVQFAKLCDNSHWPSLISSRLLSLNN